jgi:hypothetical protein
MAPTVDRHTVESLPIQFPIVLAEYTPLETPCCTNQSEPIHSVAELLAHPLVRKHGTGGIAHILQQTDDSTSETAEETRKQLAQDYEESTARSSR